MFRRTRGFRESVLHAGSLPEVRLASLDVLPAPTLGSFFQGLFLARGCGESGYLCARNILETRPAV